MGKKGLPAIEHEQVKNKKRMPSKLEVPRAVLELVGGMESVNFMNDVLR